MVRALLHERGIVIARMDEGTPENLKHYLDRLSTRKIVFDKVFIHDSDGETLRAFHEVFPPEKLHFEADPEEKGSKLTLRSGEKLLMIWDAFELLEDRKPEFAELLSHAGAIILRSKQGHLRAGGMDLYDLHFGLQESGFEFHDVLQNGVSNNISAANANIYLAFERPTINAEPQDESYPRRQFRKAEALTCLGLPVARDDGFRQLLGWGSYGFAAGVMNAAVVPGSEPLQVLARGERVPWPVQKRNQSHTGFLSASQPILFTLGSGLNILEAREVSFTNQEQFKLSRFEDFRFFEFDNTTYASHVIMRCEERGFDRKPVRPQELQTAMGISRFEREQLSLTHVGTIGIDKPISHIEKNWALFVHNGRINLIYSFNPFRRFGAESLDGLLFRSECENILRLPMPDDGIPLRNSINPIDYDDEHLLHIVHKSYPEKRYVFWAVLIDKKNLLPTRITRRPLVSGPSALWKSIIYICSAAIRGDELYLFGGIDDCAIGTWRIAITALNKEWVSIQ
jgi:hypothetical protein